jgi:four helix bundle protein
MSEAAPRRARRAVESHGDLEVYQLAFSAAGRIFELSKAFPREEMYSLTDQIRRASRSVCTNIAEGWRRRRYVAAFVNKLNEAEAEAAETQTWCAFAVECDYWDPETGKELQATYDKIIGKLVNMINDPYPWLLRNTPRGVKP